MPTPRVLPVTSATRPSGRASAAQIVIESAAREALAA
jgi:hypothetical protein